MFLNLCVSEGREKVKFSVHSPRYYEMMKVSFYIYTEMKIFCNIVSGKSDLPCAIELAGLLSTTLVE